MRRTAARLAPLSFVLVLATCVEDLTAPGACPEFCPAASITLVDTVLTSAVSGDSSYGRPYGYVDPENAPGLLAQDLPSLGRDSRPILRTSALQTRMILATGDTTTGAVIGVDSLRLALTVVNRDSAARNLTLGVYKLPIAIDSNTMFSDVSGSFAAPPIRSVNVDALLAQPGLKDPVTGDSVVVDTVDHRFTVLVKLDSAQAPLVPSDSGKLAFGIRVSADTLANASIASFENTGLGPVVVWFVKVDSLDLSVAHRTQLRSTGSTVGGFDSFVFQPPAAPLGADLIVGGVPAVRTIMRLTIPKAILDSTRIVIATLELIPTVPPIGIAADSFRVVASPVIADFGAKSPLNNVFTDTTRIYIAPTDTIRLSVTNVMISWTLNTASPTTLFLQQVPEGANFAELRFHSSLDVPYRPRLHLTYAPRYPGVHP